MVILPTLFILAGAFTPVGALIIPMIGIRMAQYEDVLGAHIVVKNRIKNSYAQSLLFTYPSGYLLGETGYLEHFFLLVRWGELQ